jgi:predicted phosphodiesterase
MNILHITDLHYNSDSYEKFTQGEIIKKLVAKIINQKIEFDLIFFTGDLVFNGSVFEDFEKAKNDFIDQICNTLRFKQENVIFCAGNHDMDRSGLSKSLEEHFELKIKTNDQLYEFFKTQDNDYKTSIKTTANYNTFIRKYYSNDSLYDLYSIHKRNIKGEDIGIFSLNSSWRSVDDFSKGKLLFPTHLLENGLEELKSIKNRFLLMHHPLHWFTDYNKPKLQELIFKNFNVIFTGHVHESEITTHYTKSNGIFINTCPATMTWDKNYLGYSIIKYDTFKSDFAVVSKYKFIDEKDDFEFIDRIEVNVPCGIIKTEQNKLQEKINNKSILELLNSKDLLLSKNFDNENDNLFLDLFNKPKLGLKPREEIDDTIDINSNIFDFNYLMEYKNNYFIFGNDKSGKTSLLKYIQIKHLKDYTTNGIIPFYIDLKNNYSLSVFDEIRKYYELSIKNTETLIKKDFLLLIDNFDINSSYYNNLIEFLDKYENVKFIIASDYYTYRVFENYKIDNREYFKLYLQDVSRKEVRSFLENNKFEINDSYDNVLEKIISFCKQLELPLNYWTISLILLVHKKQKFDLSKNIYNLLDLCVDEILDKKHMTLRNSKLEFKQLKSLCGNLSLFLLKNNSENIYSKTYLEVLEELDRLIKEDIRVKANPRETLDYLINSGILKNQDEKVSFRLNGIFEFFIALHMSENKLFRDEIINDDKLYLSFKNEFEICSGILNNDLKFYKKIYNKTETFFNLINQRYFSLGKQDTILKSKVTDKNDVNLKKITQELKTFEPLDNEKKDFINDQNNSLSINSELHIKKIYDVENFNPEIFERYISIFTRVFKTMEGIKDLNLLSNSLDFILNTYINFGFYLYEEIEQELEFKDFDESDILSLISKILPFISQMTMTENIAHYNIEKVIINKINELKNNHKENQYKLFILYFILMDIDENNIFTYTDDVIELINIGILKYSSIIKFKYYFSFKGKENTKLAQFLKEKIKEAQMKLNSKTDVSSLQSSLDNTRNKFKNN